MATLPINGKKISGSILGSDEPQIDVYDVEIDMQGTYSMKCAAKTFGLRMRLFGSKNKMLAESSGAFRLQILQELNPGTYAVSISSDVPGAAGSYELCANRSV